MLWMCKNSKKKEKIIQRRRRKNKQKKGKCPKKKLSSNFEKCNVRKEYCFEEEELEKGC